MIKHAVLEAQMNLTLSHIAMSVPCCTTFLFLSGDMLQYCHRDHSLHHLVTRLFLQSFQYGIVVLGFLNALFKPIISTAKVPRILEILMIA